MEAQGHRVGTRTSLALLSRRQLEQRLFWTAPADQDTDLTAEDPLALDYLGQQIGYWLFGALTTRTSRAQYFAVVLYGLDLAGEQSGESGGVSDEERVERFERWERLWALAVVESCGGQIPRGSLDGFRGVRGAQRVWYAGEGDLALDYPLISRQSELGGLGAYLSTLRETGLVLQGTLRAAPAAQDIMEAFWDEPRFGARHGAFGRYARLALGSRRMLPRRFEGITLRTLGERSRLTTLTQRRRHEQQRRLWEVLFENARDDTLDIATLIRAASRRRVHDPAPEEVLRRAIRRELTPVSAQLRDKLDFALRFGLLARGLLASFNRIYGSVVERGWVASYRDTVRDACPTRDLQALQRAAHAVVDHPLSASLRALPIHGRHFLTLCAALCKASPASAVQSLLEYHDAVQHDRQRGASWIRREEGTLVLSVTSYQGYVKEARFPPFKIDVVQSLLRDLGKLP